MVDPPYATPDLFPLSDNRGVLKLLAPSGTPTYGPCFPRHCFEFLEEQDLPEELLSLRHIDITFLSDGLEPKRKFERSVLRMSCRTDILNAPPLLLARLT
jgi:hypothetical protein